ncbi:MAG TPA: kelch repeat-containing protein [Candidatus Udaeobacter sp.]|nr:kelch repeat-containing protein [Candidatus Udaeobacter sp.]
MRKMHVSGWMCLIALFLGTSQKVQAQSWSFTGNMGTQRAFFTVTVLNNGEVLVAGGRDRGLYGISSAELYNPSRGTFGFTGNLNAGRANFTATLLDNGKVLIAGGDAYIFMPTGTQHVCYSSAELYDPSTGKFAITGSMHAGRCSYLTPGFTATPLNNGQVLIAGGADPNGFIPAAELYDPSTGTFSLTGSLKTPRLGHTATLLPNGDALIAGGVDSAGNYLASAELYNPVTGTFTITGSMKTSRELFTATLLDNGEVLAAGGQNSNAIAPFLSSAEIYNPSTGKWTSTGSLNAGRYNHTATLLNNGEVLIAGGGAHLASTELYNPATGKFSLAANLNTGRTDHSAVLLGNGDAMVVGGYDGSGGNIGYLSSAELFH